MQLSHPIKIKNKIAYTLYRRSHSGAWQVRIKLDSGEWYRTTTAETDLEEAKHKASALYHQAQYKLQNNLPQATRRFSSIAKSTIDELNSLRDTNQWKSVYDSYIGALNSSLIPYFGKLGIDNLADSYNGYFPWLESEFGRKPAASTINTHHAILNLIFDKAKRHGWVSELKLPVLKNTGKASNRRPTFVLEEYMEMIKKLRAWKNKEVRYKSKQMRELLYDYVLFLANTGIRPGEPSLNIKWKHIKWEKDRSSNEKLLRISVTIKKGKSGEAKTRRAVARHNCKNVLERVKNRFPDLAKMTLEKLLSKNLDEYVFRLENGERTKSLNQTFEQFLTEYDLLYGRESDDTPRTLYSLRHFYATMALTGKDPVPTYHLAMQMGTSEQMIYKHYSHLKLDDIASHLAGKNYDAVLSDEVKVTD